MPSLDGIRFIAVMVVFIGHGLTVSTRWPGSVGVTIFFFLSGYLITTLLRREYDKAGRISLGKFYLRRVLRILPPTYIAIALTGLVGVLGVLPSTINGWGVAAELLQVTNYYMVWAEAVTGTAHTGLPPESSMLWSLAVEEHFYLIFPALLILLLWRKLSYRKIGWILVTACAAAPLWRLFLMAGDASFYRLYVSTDTRFDGLLAGAALALLANPALGDRAPFGIRDRALRYIAAPIAAVVFIVVALAPQSFGLTIGDSILYACLVPLFWLVISHPEGITGRILNNPVIAHIGVLSFSIYLLHRLALGLVELVTPVPIVVDLVSLVITIVAAQLLYVAVEKPLGRVRKRLEGKLPARARASA
ncbi:acyltransferase family protein [Microbacterium sp. CFBP 13617]|uniref:acyltransferase family protein n=1 Tax=Microbacterium sp. CFBP 13617 TaxID=2774035 RepID=UPI003140A4CD